MASEPTITIPLKDYESLVRQNESLLKDLNTKDLEIAKFKRTQWKVVPRVYIDDVEALFETEFRSANQGVRYPNFPSDPKAQRIRRRAEKWIWLFANHSTSPKICEILREIEFQFRKLNSIGRTRALTTAQRTELQTFRKNFCYTIAEIHELGSFVIHGDTAMQLFEGELDTLNIFGENDKYLVPFLRAVAPVINPNAPPATFRAPQHRP